MQLIFCNINDYIMFICKQLYISRNLQIYNFYKQFRIKILYANIRAFKTF